jgi:hypothetical protein
MDPNTLVEGGVAGLLQIEKVFKDAGAKVDGIYLVLLRSSEDDSTEWVLRMITDEPKRDMIVHHVRLRRDHMLPWVSNRVRFDYVPRDHIEASKVMDYAQAMNERPLVIEGVFWKGLFLEYVLVASYPERSTAAA